VARYLSQARHTADLQEPSEALRFEDGRHLKEEACQARERGSSA